METRQLGQQGLEVAALGLGCMGWGATLAPTRTLRLGQSPPPQPSGKAVQDRNLANF
ncbi:MAG: hypothetical protein IPF84_06295 [Proteobacteria bacterium]|nr:hypothetical protein [Pseudomonadota bacterium]